MLQKKNKNKLVVKSKKKKDYKLLLLRRSISIVLFVFLIVVLIFTLKEAINWTEKKLFSKNPRFEIQNLIISSSGDLSEDFIRKRLEISEGHNLFSKKISKILERFNGIPRIEKVLIERDLPNTLKIRIEERQPVARLTNKKIERFPNLIDRHGVVFFNPSVSYKLPTITGLDQDTRPGVKLNNRDIDFSTRIITLVASNINLNKYIEIDEINIKHGDYIKLILNNNAEVRIPRFAFEANLNKLATIIKIEDGQGRNIKSVDLTVDSIKVPVRYF